MAIAEFTRAYYAMNKVLEDASQGIGLGKLTVAPENGAGMAGKKGPAMWLRCGPLPAQRGRM